MSTKSLLELPPFIVEARSVPAGIPIISLIRIAIGWIIGAITVAGLWWALG